MNHVLEVEESPKNSAPSSPASEPNASEISEESDESDSQTATDEVTGNSSNAGEPRFPSERELGGRVLQRIYSWHNRSRRELLPCERRTLLDRKAIKGGPYTDLQLLWFRKKQIWPLPSETVNWPPTEKENLLVRLAAGNLSEVQEAEHELQLKQVDKDLLELVKFADEFWSSEQKDRVKRLDSLNADNLSGRNELYQLVGLYAVFLSVFFSSASQTNNLKCQDWPILVILTLVVTGYTLVIFYQKSCLNHRLRDDITDLNEKHKHIESQIKELREQGPSFGFKAEDLKSKPSSFDYDKILGLIAIGIFTIIICIGIYFVLCRPGETLENKRLSTWSLLRL